MQAFKTIGLLLLAVVLAVAAYIIYQSAPRLASAGIPGSVISSFEECAAAGNAVMESYPRQCRSADGRLFVEEIDEQPGFSEVTSPGRCAVAGCSQQLCVLAEEAPTIITTCELRSEYICYAEARCEVQPSGMCGWTPTSELQACLANPPTLENEFEGELQVM